MDKPQILVILHNTTNIAMLHNDLTEYFPNVDIIFWDESKINNDIDISKYKMLFINYDTVNLISPELTDLILKIKDKIPVHVAYYRKFDGLYQIYRMSALKRTIINYELIGATLDIGMNVTNKLIKYFNEL